ncbi:MAG: 50S ribosomal protein L16 [Candidatus Bathyarchaeia archaeon]
MPRMKGRNYRLASGSTYSRKEYIHGVPAPKITKFTMGSPTGNYAYRASLIALTNGQIRHSALEAARVAANKVLQDELGETGYFLKVNLYPHQVLREHKLATQAGADRLSRGMQAAFGSPVGTAARVKNGQEIMTVMVPGTALNLVKEAMRRGASKLPITCRIEVRPIAEAVAPAAASSGSSNAEAE